MGSRRRGTTIVAVIVALIVIVVLSRPRQDPYLRQPLDPRGTGPRGLAALVELTRGYDAKVRIGGMPQADDDIVFEPKATLTGGPDEEVTRWVGAGGTLVVADPEATQSAPLIADPYDATSTDHPGECALDALDGIGALGAGLPRTLAPGPADSACFADANGAGLVVHRLGSGLVVTISRLEPFLNRSIGIGDSATLAVTLLAPRAGTRLRVLDPNRFVGDEKVGDGTVLGALPARHRQAFGELVIAFLVYGLVRGRRLGKVVPEELPVEVPSSDLVLAVGELLARGDDLSAVAERLRRSARRELGIALGLGADPYPEQLAASLTGHVSLDAVALRRALVDPVPDIASLIEVSHQLDRLRKDIHDIHAAT